MTALKTKYLRVVLPAFALASACSLSSLAWAVGMPAADFKTMNVALTKRPLQPSELDKLAQYLKSNPSDARCLYLLGRNYERNGYMEMAVESYEKARQSDRKLPEPFLILSASRLKSGLDPKAVDAIVKAALVDFADDPETLTKMGVYLHLLHLTAQADQLYKQAASKDPGNPDLLVARAFALADAGQFAESLVCADKALAREATNIGGHAARGKALVGLHRRHEAADALGKAFYGTMLDAELTVSYAELLISLNRPIEALEPYLCVLAMTTNQPRVSPYVKQKIKGLLKHVNELQAKVEIDRVATAMQHSEYESKLHFAMGDVFDKCGRYNEAMREYKAGIKIEPTFARAYLRLARDYDLHAHDLNKARMNYDMAYRLDASDPEIKAAFERFGQWTVNRHNNLSWRLKQRINGRQIQ